MGNSKLDNVVKGYQGCSSGALNSNFNQSGGSIGFTHDLNKPVGGLPERIGYVSQPEYVDGKLVGDVTSDGRLMGKDGMCGGAKKKTSGKKNNMNNLASNKLGLNNNVGPKTSIILNNNVKKNTPKRKRSNKNKNKNKGKRSKNKRKQQSKNKRNKNRKRTKKNRHRRQSGGDLPGIFTPDMIQRDVGCRQPNWDPKCT